MMAGKRFTIAPLELFEEEQAELLFYHNHQKKENETVLYNILRKNNVAVIFGIDKSAQTFLNEQYPEARFYSQSTPFIDYFSVKSRLGNSKKMYASIRKDGIESIALNEDICFWLIPLNVRTQKTVFTIYCTSGNNWSLIRNGMSYT